jgi:branched-subunit amino acid transport protein
VLSRRVEFMAGVKAELPILLGVSPFGLILSPAHPRLLAGALAALIAWRSRNALLAIAAGMVALWLLQAMIPG